MCRLRLLVVLATAVASCVATDQWQPEQIHISYGGKSFVELRMAFLTRAPLALQIFHHLRGGRTGTPPVYLGSYWS